MADQKSLPPTKRQNRKSQIPQGVSSGSLPAPKKSTKGMPNRAKRISPLPEIPLSTVSKPTVVDNSPGSLLDLEPEAFCSRPLDQIAKGGVRRSTLAGLDLASPPPSPYTALYGALPISQPASPGATSSSSSSSPSLPPPEVSPSSSKSSFSSFSSGSSGSSDDQYDPRRPRESTRKVQRKFQKMRRGGHAMAQSIADGYAQKDGEIDALKEKNRETPEDKAEAKRQSLYANALTHMPRFAASLGTFLMLAWDGCGFWTESHAVLEVIANLCVHGLKLTYVFPNEENMKDILIIGNYPPSWRVVNWMTSSSPGIGGPSLDPEENSGLYYFYDQECEGRTWDTWNDRARIVFSDQEHLVFDRAQESSDYQRERWTQSRFEDVEMDANYIAEGLGFEREALS